VAGSVGPSDGLLVDVTTALRAALARVVPTSGPLPVEAALCGEHAIEYR